MSEPIARQKIAILGGGVGAMVTAFALTSQPDWQERYEITVYQLGWRLGGKGASGRNLERQARIEEHGLHIWFGFYENAFALIRRCYAELGRTPGQPLATWDEAFKPVPLVALEEYFEGRYRHWVEEVPLHPGTPGDGTPLAAMGEAARRFVTEIGDRLRRMPRRAAPAVTAVETGTATPGLRRRIRAHMEKAVLDLGTDLARTLFHQGVRAVTAHPRGVAPRASLQYAIFWLLLLRVRRWLAAGLIPLIDRDTDCRRIWEIIDFSTAIINGIIHDRLIERGFDVINDLDGRQWMRRNGLSELTQHGSLVVGFYDAAFATLRGSAGRVLPGVRASDADLAAGTGLRGMLRMGFGYKGAFMYKMQAGMGDTIFAPLYQVLKRRGVTFTFFHRVRALHLSADHTCIDRIDVGRQVTLAHGTYDPLVTINELPCWPNQPLWDQIEEGTDLREQQVDLESYWTPWEDREILQLRRGVDFDEVVLGIALPALGVLCTELVDASPHWRNMVRKIASIRTQALQLWLTPTLEGLGWPLWQKGAPTLTSYAEPLDTWADMTHLVPREQWPVDQTPGDVAYFCGAMPDGDEPDPPYFTGHPEFARRAHAAVKRTALAFLRDRVTALWPDACRRGSTALDWDLLLDPAGGTAEARFDAQYWHANIDPTERYVLSGPGSINYRLPAGASGFGNLYLAGDWTRNGLDLGCVESAVMSGLQASRAISGWPREVPGEHDLR